MLELLWDRFNAAVATEQDTHRALSLRCPLGCSNAPLKYCINLKVALGSLNAAPSFLRVWDTLLFYWAVELDM